MKYVLDSSVALKTVLPESDSPLALRLIADFQNATHELMAPDVFHVEIGHALTRAERQRPINPPDGWRLWQGIMADAPDLHASLPLMPRAFELSSTMQIGLYDCLYVTLAEQEHCFVVTADFKLIRAFPTLTIPLTSI